MCSICETRLSLQWQIVESIPFSLYSFIVSTPNIRLNIMAISCSIFKYKFVIVLIFTSTSYYFVARRLYIFFCHIGRRDFHFVHFLLLVPKVTIPNNIAIAASIILWRTALSTKSLMSVALKLDFLKSYVWLDSTVSSIYQLYIIDNTDKNFGSFHTSHII